MKTLVSGEIKKFRLSSEVCVCVYVEVVHAIQYMLKGVIGERK